MNDKIYFIVQFSSDKFDDIVRITQHRNEKDFMGTLDFLKSKISDELYWELIGTESEKYIYIKYLYQFYHTKTIKDVCEHLVEIHQELSNNMDWIYETIKELKVLK